MNDEQLMRRALDLADGAAGSVSPRPPVGAVVVDTEGRIVAQGATTPSPGPHAEVVALDAAGDRARGGTLYVTLEPCAHHGATPPCADAVADAGIARVVVGARDPNPQTDGKGIVRLLDAGIDVIEGVLGDEAQHIVQPFGVWVRTGRPLVTLKMAATLDGKVAAPDGTSRWITGPEARAEVHELRGRVDAVMVGSGTVVADDPALTCRSPGYTGPQPTRVVWDSSGTTPPDAALFDGPSVVLTTTDAAADRVAAWKDRGVDVVVLPASEEGVQPEPGLDALGERGLCHVLCEGGPRLAATLVGGGLVDRLALYLAPKLVGGDAPGLLGWGVKTIADAWELEIEGVTQVGTDLRIDARRTR